MDELTSSYYNPPPPIHHPYYQPQPPPPPPPPPGTATTPVPITISQHPIHVITYPTQPLYHLPPQTQSADDQVRTLFVAGLPPDIKQREIYNLFRDFPGYQTSHLRPPSSSKAQPFAFATFVDQHTAVLAMHALNGMVFDLEKGSTLFVDLAKSNSRSKRTRADEESQGSEKRHKVSPAFSRSYDSGLGSIHMSGINNSAYNTTIAYPTTQSHANVHGGSVNASASKSNNTPCPTLFVANLGPGSSEEELVQVFSRCRGFIKLKMQSTYGAPVAFVDFQDTSCSTEALSYLQGTVLYSSTTGEGMRLEFAKSRMGMRSKKTR